MRYILIIPIAMLSICSWSSFKTVNDQKNPLYGKVFREINEIAELKSYTYTTGALIETDKNTQGDFRFAAGYFTNAKNGVCILEELLPDDSKGKVKYKILDTINIQKLKSNEQLSLCNCKQGDKPDSEIIAISRVDEHKEYFDKIVKAWRMDTKSQKIIPLKDTKGISCLNEGYGI
ncbi:hypothetical protein [Sphingobacterium sp. Ag1]|uniref:hypothetical protein n=1 Tax=Sphingobacterium sp. Ag1 TaxID=1643451 RepID=UPI000628012C|nr:hypothetical protein [Sphingobacterium sp. Ag1]